MQLTEIRAAYPRTYRLITGLIADGLIHPDTLDGLSHYAIERIESGETSRRDAVLLLRARGGRRHGRAARGAEAGRGRGR